MPEFEVESFERVSATPNTTLLRIAGRWQSPQRERLNPPLLVIDDGRRTHRLSALPGPEDASPHAGPDAPLWRAAFSAPAGLVDQPRAVFALDAGRGLIVDLPQPASSPVRRKVEPVRDERRARQHARELEQLTQALAETQQ